MLKKCWFCKQEILENNLRIEKINNVNRKFHKSNNCYEKFLKASHEKNKYKMSEEDKKSWKQLYDYVKKDILKYTDEMKLSNHMVLRLKGLRYGTYKPNRKNSAKEISGYPFEIILTTFKINKQKIEQALMFKTFENENVKFNYVMAIINNSINDVYLRCFIASRNKENFKLLNIRPGHDPFMKDNDYISNDIENDKVADMLEDIF